MNTEQDRVFMLAALEQANLAASVDEVPVGAVVVQHGQIISRAHNQVITRSDPSAHAEVLAIREAAKIIGNYRLVNATLYVTLEPCPMCAGMLVHARIQRLVFGAFDLKTGACGSITNLAQQAQLNHQFEVSSGVMGVECGEILSAFFANKRALKKRAKQQE